MVNKMFVTSRRLSLDVKRDFASQLSSCQQTLEVKSSGMLRCRGSPEINTPCHDRMCPTVATLSFA